MSYYYKPLLNVVAFTLSILMVSSATPADLSSTQLMEPMAQGRVQPVALGSPSKEYQGAFLLKEENLVSPAAFGDSYSLAPWLIDDLNQFYPASATGTPTVHTFDGNDESGGNNTYGSVGGSFRVSEGIVDLGGGIERYVVEVSAVDSSLNDEPWVDASWAGQVFTGWILEVGTIDGGSNAISPGYNFSVQDSGFIVFNSAGTSIANFTLFDASTLTTLAGSAGIDLGGSDIAGFDVATIQMYWDIAPVGDEADLDLQFVDVTNGTYAAGDTIEILNYTKNIGGATSTAYTITYYASADTTITNGDILLGAEPPRDPLEPAGVHYYNTTAELPPGLPNGDYYIGAILTITDADAGNNVNHDPEPITVGSDPDILIRPLTLDFVQPPEAPGQVLASPVISPLPARKVIAPELTAKLKKRGKVNLIVGLNLATQLEGRLNTIQAQQQRQSIRAQGNLLSGELRGLNAQIRRQFEFVPYMALTADQATLDFLIQSPLVTSITEDRISKAYLASSNPVIGTPFVWAEGYDGSGWAVAVLDTGVDNTHFWFTEPVSKVVSEACYSTNLPGEAESWCPGGASSSTAVDSGLNCALSVAGCDHGTHVAGIVAGNDETGPDFGVARGADIIAMQVFSKFLTEADCGTGQAPCTASFPSDQIAALERVLVLADNMNIAAVNMSLGGGRYDDQTTCDTDNPGVKAAIDNLRSVGIATVIASGNNGWKDSIGAPGCISSAVSVGATSDGDTVASFSNIYPQIHLLAPGVDIDSSVPNDGIVPKDGTSMSTPHVAGAWAVMKQLNPNASVGEVLTTLQNSATLVDDLRSGGVETGMQRIDLELAIGEPRTTFGLSNEGAVSLSITSIAPETPAPWVSWLPQAPFDVAPGELVIVSVFVDYKLAPADMSQVRLLVNSNDPDESPYPNGIFVNVTKTQASDSIFRDGFEGDAQPDTDGDRLPDAAETNTGVYVDANNTGTDPVKPDTDGDGIGDGDEVLGTLAGLDLPAMGTNPLRKDLLLEYDWFDDGLDCGAHSHQPTATAIALATTAFSISPVTNPGSTGGVNLISDYGQGGVFTGGNLIDDADGVLVGGVSSTEYLSYKSANFAANRNGYFHYVLLPHRYNIDSSSSGQAEVWGDDLIVSLYCANSNSNVANTILHEVGHNLNLRHGGDENCNYKPNYNSVMNYKYQFSGIDDNCTPSGDGVLSYSNGNRIDLNENNLNENNGTCGFGNPFDWNGNSTIESSIVFDVNSSGNNTCAGTLTILHDFNDWGNLVFSGLGDSDGAPVVPLEIITEQPVPAEYLNRID